MQQHRTAAPGALAATPAGHLDAIRAIVAEHHRPVFGFAPTDGEAGSTGTATAAPGAPASGGDPLGLAPASSTSDSHQAGPQVTFSSLGGLPAGQAPAPAGTHAAATPPVVVPPAGGQQGAPVTAVPTPPPNGQPGQQQGSAPAAGAGPLSEAPLDSFPPEIRDYVRELRREAGDNRIKAKNTDAAVAEAAASAQQKLLDGILKAAGLITDVDEHGNPVGDAVQLTPEQRVEQATQQVASLTGERDTFRGQAAELARELAIWKGAHTHGADPQRLADSRTFMSRISSLDTAAADFETQLATAIGAAVASDPYFRNTAPGLTPAAALPQVPSGGDFGGGPAHTDAMPSTVDGFRELLTKQRRESRGQS